MKAGSNCSKVTLLCILLMVSFSAIATIQEQDLIIVEGARYYTYSLPTLAEALPDTDIPEFSMLHTANYKGYRASWAVINNQLFLIGVEGNLLKSHERRLYKSQEIFPTLTFPVKITAFSGVIKLRGRPSDYVVKGQDIIETTEIELHIKEGSVAEVIHHTVNRRKEARDKGMLLYHGSTFMEDYERHFTVSDVEAGNGSTFGVHFDNPEWSAKLIPKLGCQYSCYVSAVFPIVNEKKVEVSIAPLNIMSAFSKCFSHPFVIDRFENGGATGIRMRITGDRLHWNTTELNGLLRKLKGKDASEQELKNWAYLIIDDKEKKHTSIYLHRVSGELIYEDKSKWPYEPILVKYEPE